MPNNQYLSFHIYYAEPWEPLLTGAIRPLVKKLVGDGLITQYFFIRYWERGPHIRLRLKKEAEIDEAIITKAVHEEISNFILKNPSKLFLMPEMEEKKVAESWRNNNQIYVEEYQPEVSRYGGLNGLALAELQFFASSQMVLDELVETKNWSYDHALGAAIKHHLEFVFAINMTPDTAAIFFEKICQDWLPRAISEEGSAEERTKIFDQFQNAYSVQKEVVLPYIQRIWEQLGKSSEGSDSPSLKNWLSINQAVYSNLQLLEKSGLLNWEINNLESDKSYESKRWNILGDFVHLTNNRLGVLNRDEGFLAFMLAKALKGPLNIA